MADVQTVSELAQLGAGIAIGFGAVGAGLGIGIEFGGRLQLSAQYFNNMGKLFNEDKVDTATIKEDVKESLKDGNFKGFKLSLAILF